MASWLVCVALPRVSRVCCKHHCHETYIMLHAGAASRVSGGCLVSGSARRFYVACSHKRPFFHWPLSSLHLARPAFGMLAAAIGCRTSHPAACLSAATIDEEKRAISTCTLGPLRVNTAEPDRAPRNLLANTACSSATSLPKPLNTSCFKRLCYKSKGARTAPRGPRLRTSLSFKLCPPLVGRGCICCGGSGRASACWSQGAPE